jgi:hypothetical protein
MRGEPRDEVRIRRSATRLPAPPPDSASPIATGARLRSGHRRPRATDSAVALGCSILAARRVIRQRSHHDRGAAGGRIGADAAAARSEPASGRSPVSAATHTRSGGPIRRAAQRSIRLRDGTRCLGLSAMGALSPLIGRISRSDVEHVAAGCLGLTRRSTVSSRSWSRISRPSALSAVDTAWLAQPRR